MERSPFGPFLGTVSCVRRPPTGRSDPQNLLLVPLALERTLDDKIAMPPLACQGLWLAACPAKEVRPEHQSEELAKTEPGLLGFNYAHVVNEHRRVTMIMPSCSRKPTTNSRSMPTAALQAVAISISGNACSAAARSRLDAAQPVDLADQSSRAPFPSQVIAAASDV